MQKVVSSNIAEVGYAGTTLTVKFKSGVTWSYHGVPPEVHREMLSADSVGGYFSRHIRNGFKGTKHDD